MSVSCVPSMLVLLLEFCRVRDRRYCNNITKSIVQIDFVATNSINHAFSMFACVCMIESFAASSVLSLITSNSSTSSNLNHWRIICTHANPENKRRKVCQESFVVIVRFCSLFVNSKAVDVTCSTHRNPKFLLAVCVEFLSRSSDDRDGDVGGIQLNIFVFDQEFLDCRFRYPSLLCSHSFVARPSKPFHDKTIRNRMVMVGGWP